MQRTQHGGPLQLDIRLYDNASSDTTIVEIRRFAPDVPLKVSPINRGYGVAHNALITAANLQIGDFYLALNPDVVLQERYIVRLVEVLQNDVKAGWATGALYQPDGRLYSLGHALCRDGYAINIGYGMEVTSVGTQWIVPTEVFGAPGAAVLIKAELLRDLGTAFDETFFVYNEDVDFDWRARRRGWRCWYVPTARAIHEGSHANAEGQARAVVNRWLMILKHATTWDLLVYHPPRWIVHILIRFCITPHRALWMLKRFFRLAPHAWQARRTDPPRRWDANMAMWFAWAETQPTMQAQSFGQRWRELRKKRL